MNDAINKFTEKCLLCGAPRLMLGQFIPEPKTAKRLGQPEGKQRIFFYGLCETCFTPDQKEEMMEKVENKFLQDWSVQ